VREYHRINNLNRMVNENELIEVMDKEVEHHE
jgi:hypothetical protein